MIVLSFLIVPELFKSDLLLDDLTHLIQHGQVSENIHKDISCLIGSKICTLIATQDDKELDNVNSATDLIMNSELLSGGLQPNLFYYFSEQSLKDMAKYAKIG